MSSVSSTESVAAQDSLNGSLRDLWTAIEGYDADKHSVVFGREAYFDAGALSRLVARRQVTIDPAVGTRYYDDMRTVAAWSGGRSRESAAAERNGWVRLVGQGRPEYGHPTNAALGVEPVLDFIIKGSDPDKLGYDMHVTPVTSTDGEWNDDESIPIIDTDEIAAGALRPATLEETLALDAIVRSIRNVVRTPVS